MFWQNNYPNTQTKGGTPEITPETNRVNDIFHQRIVSFTQLCCTNTAEQASTQTWMCWRSSPFALKWAESAQKHNYTGWNLDVTQTNVCAEMFGVECGVGLRYFIPPGQWFCCPWWLLDDAHVSSQVSNYQKNAPVSENPQMIPWCLHLPSCSLTAKTRNPFNTFLIT